MIKHKMLIVVLLGATAVGQLIFCMEGTDISQTKKNDQLKEAVQQKRSNDVEHWLKLGADANNTYPIFWGQASMLLIAINNEDMESVTHLLNYGANPSSFLENEGFLRCLRLRRLHKMIELMQQYRISLGANPYEENAEGKTAFDALKADTWMPGTNETGLVLLGQDTLYGRLKSIFFSCCSQSKKNKTE